MSTKASWPRAARWMVVLAFLIVATFSARSIFHTPDGSKPFLDAELSEHESDVAENTEYWLRQRGLQFGLPHNAYAHAVSRMRAMAIQRRSHEIAAGAAVAAVPGWQFIGPEPMNNARANFGGPLLGNTYTATGRVTAITVGTAPQNGTAPICVGTANGGVWMSTDNGANFTPITDSLPTQAIGSMLGCGPGMLVGTGEGNAAIDSYYGQGLFSSNDLMNWTSVAPAVFGRQAISALGRVCDRIYAGTAFGLSATRGGAIFPESFGGNVYESTDSGVTWTQDALPASSGVRTIVSDAVGDDLSIHGYLASDGVGGFTTSLAPDNFDFTTCQNSTYPTHWTNMNIPAASFGRASIAVTQLCPIDAASCPVPPDTVYAMVGSQNPSTLYSGFFVSTDSSATWTAGTVPTVNLDGTNIDGTHAGNFSQAFYDQALGIFIAPNNAVTLFYGGVAPYSSNDMGMTWNFAATNGGTHSDQHAMVLSPTDVNLWGNDGGLFRQAADGTWSSLNNTLGVGQIYGIGPHPTDSTRAIAGFQDNGTQLYTGGLAWDEVETGDGGYALFDHKDPNLAYHTYATTNARPNIATSQDSGVSWDTKDPTAGLRSALVANEAASFYPPLAGDPAVAHRVLFGAHHVYASIDGMMTWQLQSAQDLTGGCADASCALSDIEFAPSNHTKAYAISKEAPGMPPIAFKVFNTNQADTNSGAAWLDVTGNLPFNSANTQATSIAISPFDPNVAYLGLSGFTASTGIGHVFKTVDFGAHWAQADGGMPDVPLLHLMVDKADLSGHTVLAGTDIGIFRTTDGGSTWSEFSSPIPAVPVMDIEQNDLGAVFAGTHGRGAYVLNESIPSATATATASATPTPTPEVCGAITVTAQGNNNGQTGQAVAAGSFKVQNICPDAIIVSVAQVSLSGSSLFSAMSMKSTVGGMVQNTAGTPASSTSFNFNPAVIIGGGGTGFFDLSGTIANSPGTSSSTQMLTAIGAVDGVSGDPVVSGTVPQTLGTINLTQATATPTSTSSAAKTPTPTATRTPTATATGTPAATATRSATATATGIATSTATSTIVARGSITPTATQTAIATATSTATPTATPSIIPVPAPLRITVAGLRNGVVNYGTVRVGRLTKRRFVLSNINRTHTAITFTNEDGLGHSFFVNPAGDFGFLQGPHVQNSNCPQVLLANRRCWLDVYFVPQNNTSNPKVSTLSIFDNASNGPKQTFGLTGNGR